MNAHGTQYITNPAITSWVEETAKLCCPSNIFWCKGSEEEKDFLTARAVEQGILIELNQAKLPGGYYHRSNSNDVARTERLTFICENDKNEVGPTNNWADPAEMRAKLEGLLKDSMKGRTLYVIPYLMGPAGSSLSKVGIEITDSIYVVLNMRIMTRMGEAAVKHLGNREDFNKGLHCTLDVNPDRRYICHFPKSNEIVSVGSGYGGNALLGKKCLALRIASTLGRAEGWLAEHMLILGVESPAGEKTYVAAAFPSACGKTNFAMLIPPAQFKGWKIWTVGDDIAWMKPGTDGKLYAINPENGYFGVVPGTNSKSNPNAVATISHDTLYTNVALTPEMDVWWEGKDGAIPPKAIDWKGHPWTPSSKEKAAHPNSRFTAPMRNNPVLSPEADLPKGVPISAIIFGGRRADTMPLIMEAFDWDHGVYLGASLGSEMTAAAVGGMGQVRRDPMAMLPFCGYHMGDYFAHWFGMRGKIKEPPKIFHVNWFRKDAKGNFLWPGFGDNMRVLKWIVDRCRGRAEARKTPLGWMPRFQDLETAGLREFDQAIFDQLQAVHFKEWKEEMTSQNEFFGQLQPKLPKQILSQQQQLISRLEN